MRFNKASVGSCTWVTATPCNTAWEGVAGKLPRGKGPGVAGRQQCAQVAKKTKGILVVSGIAGPAGVGR